jgi:hypothetical protein
MSEVQRLRMTDPLERRKVSEGLEKYYQGPYYTSHVFTEESRRAISEAHLGKVNSEETKQLMSKAAAQRWRDPEYQQHQFESWHRRPTLPELEVLDVLNKYYPNEWQYTGNGRIWIEGRNPDFMNVNGKKLVIEVFGIFWHTEEEMEELIAHYKEFGFKCLILWEYETLYEEPIRQKVENLLRES